MTGGRHALEAVVDSAIAAHAADTTDVHGIADTSQLGGGGVVWPLPAVGRWIWPTATAVSTAAFANGDARLLPLMLNEDVTIDRIACEVVTTPGSAGSVIRMGIYAAGATNVPGALILDAGTVSGETTGVKDITISQALPAGLYWLLAVNQGTPTTNATLRHVASLAVPYLFSTTVQFASVTRHCYGQSGVTGALPGPWGSVALQQFAPMVAVRLAS